jgi:hypothetical protein
MSKLDYLALTRYLVKFRSPGVLKDIGVALSGDFYPEVDTIACNFVIALMNRGS